MEGRREGDEQSLEVGDGREAEPLGGEWLTAVKRAQVEDGPRLVRVLGDDPEAASGGHRCGDLSGQAEGEEVAHEGSQGRGRGRSWGGSGGGGAKGRGVEVADDQVGGNGAVTDPAKGVPGGLLRGREGAGAVLLVAGAEVDGRREDVGEGDGWVRLDGSGVAGDDVQQLVPLG